MKRKQKTFFGLLGLSLVAAMTGFAATIPIPGANATTATVTDTITVRVIAPQIDVSVVTPKDGDTYVRPSQAVNVEFAHVNDLTITLKVVDQDGVEHTYDFGSYTSDGSADSVIAAIDLESYGYGDYTLTAHGTNTDGIFDEESVEFRYLPITSDVDEEEETGKIFVDLDYDEAIVCSADINIYNGNTLVVPPSPLHVNAPTAHVEIPVEKLESGSYRVETIAYDCPTNPDDEPQPLPFPAEDNFDYEKTPVPDTGSFFMGLNISKTDYLVTALIVFFAFSMLSLGIIIKGKKNNKRR